MDVSVAELLKLLKAVVIINGEDEIYISDHKKFREKVMDALVSSLDSKISPPVREISKWFTRRLAVSSGVVPASTHALFLQPSLRKSIDGIIPAWNVAENTYEKSRLLFKSSIAQGVGVQIFQATPHVAPMVLAAALKEGFRGPVFLQRDQLQAQVAPFKENPEQERKRLVTECQHAIEADQFNLNIDTSMLINPQTATYEERLKQVCEELALIVSTVREIEPEGVHVSIGAELSSQNGRNINVDELRTLLDGVLQLKGLENSKKADIAYIQTEWLPTETSEPTYARYKSLEELGKVSKEAYKMGGVAIRGGIPLGDAELDRLRQIEVPMICLDVPLDAKQIESFYKKLNVRGTLERTVESMEILKVVPKASEEIRKLVLE